MNSSGVEDHTLEGAVLNVLVVVGHMNLPLARLIRLEGGVEGAVVLRDRAAQSPCSQPCTFWSKLLPEQILVRRNSPRLFL